MRAAVCRDAIRAAGWLAAESHKQVHMAYLYATRLSIRSRALRWQRDHHPGKSSATRAGSTTLCCSSTRSMCSGCHSSSRSPAQRRQQRLRRMRRSCGKHEQSYSRAPAAYHIATCDHCVLHGCLVSQFQRLACHDDLRQLQALAARRLCHSASSRNACCRRRPTHRCSTQDAGHTGPAAGVLR